MKKPWRYRVNNKMRGAFGETDFDTRTITINKKLHKKANLKKYRVAKKDKSLLNTIVHELTHKKHPKATERSVVKKTRTALTRMSPKAKKRAYRLFHYPTRTGARS